jgi:small subunit ribosomal protein S21
MPKPLLHLEDFRVHKVSKYLATSLRQVIVVALIRIRDNEAFEQAFRRFKKACEKSGILSEVKKREHFEKPSVRKKKKSMAARKRLLKKSRKGPY